MKASKFVKWILPFLLLFVSGTAVLAEGDDGTSDTSAGTASGENTQEIYEKLATEYANQANTTGTDVNGSADMANQGTNNNNSEVSSGVTYESTETVDSGKNQTTLPDSATGQKFEGSGTVLDYQTTETKTFYTIKTTDGKVFYLVIDNEKSDGNTYFLEEVNSDKLNVTGNQPAQTATPAADPDAAAAKSSGKSNLILPVVLLAGLAGAYIYLTKIKGKKDDKKETQVPMPEEEDLSELDEELMDDEFEGV